MRGNSLKLAIAGSLLMATGVAGAAPSPATTTLNVSANVPTNCLVTAAALAFGDYDASAPINGQADLSVRCTNGTPYRIKLGAGNTGTILQRLLTSGGNQLEYNLYTDAGRGTIWGETIGVNTVPGIGQGMSINKARIHTVYGTLANSDANQDAPTGSYSDLVAVTVEY